MSLNAVISKQLFVRSASKRPRKLSTSHRQHHPHRTAFPTAMDPTVTLKSRDGHQLIVDQQIAQRLGVVRRTMQQPQGLISLCDIEIDMLRLVYQWMVHHRADWPELTASAGFEDGDPHPSWKARTAYVLDSAWEREFFGDICMDDLLRLATAARYLQVEVMKQAVCRHISALIHGRTERQLRELFGLPQPKVAPSVLGAFL